MQLAAFLGFSPGGTCTPETPCFDLREGVFVSAYSSNELVLDPEKSALLYTLLCTGREAVHTVNIGVVQRRNLLHDLLNFYRLHLENFPQINSHLILQEVLD